MWHKSIFDTVEQGKKRGLCLYGAGYWGKVGYKLFKKLGLTPLCYCDDNSDKWNQECQGLPIYSLEEAADKYPDAIYIMCIEVPEKREPNNKESWRKVNLENMRKRLKSLGIYNSNSELRINMYLFLLDLDGMENIKAIWEKNNFAEEDLIKADDIHNLVILNHMGGAGSTYFEQKMDSHPNILCMPMSREILWTVYKKRLKYLEGEELLIEMTAQMLGYLHSEYEDLYCVGRSRFYSYYLDKDGNFIKDILIDPAKFIKYLRIQFGEEIKLHSLGHMLKVYFAAYNNCLGKKRQENIEYWLFYHMHNVDFNISEINKHFQVGEFQRIENLILIREPVQHFFSWFRRRVIIGEYRTILAKMGLWYALKDEMGINLEKKQGQDNVKVVRFEDLKFQSEGTMRSICNWLKIPYMDTMKSTTINGITVYWPFHMTDGSVKYITGDDTTTVAQKDFSEVLDIWDETRMNMVYAKFKKAYGYENDVPEFTKFSKETLDELLKKDFKFAKIAQEVIEEEAPEEEWYDVNSFVKEKFYEYMCNYQEGTEYYDYIKPVEE